MQHVCNFSEDRCEGAGVCAGNADLLAAGVKQFIVLNVPVKEII